MSKSGRRLSATLAMATLGALLGPAATALADEGENPDCPRQSAPTAPQAGQPVRTPVELSILEAPEPINLGSEDFEEVVVKADPPLEEAIGPEQISLFSPKSPRRTGSSLETAHLDKPTFSEPEIFSEGERIAFTVCVPDKSVDAGSYTGQVLIGGPKGVKGTAATITVNEKNKTLFLIGVIVGLLLAAALSYLRALKANRDKLAADVAKPWRAAWSKTWNDPWLVVITLAALGAAYFGMQKIYAKDP